MQQPPEQGHPTGDRPELRLAPEPRAAPHAATESDPAREVYAAIAEHLTHHAMAVANPENNLVAALLNCTAEQAAAVLALLEDDDIEGHLPGVVIDIIRHLVTAGTEPIPQTVMARAQGALDDITARTPHPSFRTLVLYVSEVYTMRMPLRPWTHACLTVENSYRRRYAATGLRKAQMAEAFADIEELDTFDRTSDHAKRAHRQRIDTLRRRVADDTAAREAAAAQQSSQSPDQH